MKTQSIYLFIIFCIFGLAFGDYSSKDKVVVLTKENFAREIIFTSESSIVEFYAPWCGHCKNLEPEYKKAANNLDGIVKIAAIDCDQEKELCGIFQIKGFPTIKHFPSQAGKKEGKPWKEPTDYQGPRSSGAIIKFALNNLVSYVVKATEKTVQDLKEPIALLFTEKKETSNLYKGLSCHFHGRLVLGEIHSSQKLLVDKYNIKKFPTLIVVGGSAGDRGKIFEGKIGYRSLQSFLNPFAKQPERPQTPSSSSSQEDSNAEPPPPPNPKILYHATSKEQFDEFCLNKTRGLCLISFLDSYEKERHELLLKQLEAVVEKHYSMFHIIWVEGPPQEALYQSLGLGGGFPGLAVYSPKLKRSIPFVGSFNEESISEFLGSLRSPKTKSIEVNLAPFVKPEVIVPDPEEKDEL